jgi:hypothetical protein
MRTGGVRGVGRRAHSVVNALDLLRSLTAALVFWRQTEAVERTKAKGQGRTTEAMKEDLLGRQ